MKGDAPAKAYQMAEGWTSLKTADLVGLRARIEALEAERGDMRGHETVWNFWSILAVVTATIAVAVLAVLLLFAILVRCLA